MDSNPHDPAFKLPLHDVPLLSDPSKPTEDRSPAGISSLQTSNGGSEQSTPPATPHEERPGWDSGRFTKTSLGSLSMRSIDSESNLSSNSSSPDVDVRLVVQRLAASPLTGQVVAWAWERAAAISTTKRAPSSSLLAALWPATERVAGKCTAEDCVDMAGAWATLLKKWPRYFRLPADTMSLLTTHTFPAAIKRMDEARLARLIRVCGDIAEHRVDPALADFRRSKSTASARDLMQPIFAIITAEVAWRLSAPCESSKAVSVATAELIITTSKAWRWTAVPHHDSAALVSIKTATRQGLAVITHHLKEVASSLTDPLSQVS